MASLLFFMCTLLTFSSSFHGISAVNYLVFNEAGPQHEGRVKFEQIIGGIPYTKQIMGQINNFLWTTVLQQNTPADRKELENDSVIVYIIDNIPGADGITWGSSRINVSAVYMRNYNGPMGLKKEFTSLLHHEMTHVFQWNGEGKAPGGLVEGIADFTLLKANLYPPSFMRPGAGDRWDKGYDTTARFLEYCDSLVPNFVAKMNKMIRYTYDVSFFKNITGKPVEKLWKDYKAKYPGVK